MPKKEPLKSQFIRIGPEDSSVFLKDFRSSGIYLTTNSEKSGAVFILLTPEDIKREKIQGIIDRLDLQPSILEARFVCLPEKEESLKILLKEFFPAVRGKAFETSVDLIISPKSFKASIAKGSGGKTKKTNKLESKGKGPIRVLVIDDSKTIRQIMKKSINDMEGFVVVGEVEDPREAIRIARECSPDVMTMDINMPHMSGVELLEKLLPQKWIPTVIVSALSILEGSKVLDALEAGAVDYIQKPDLAKMKGFNALLEEKLRVCVKEATRTRLKKMVPKSADIHNFPKDLIAIGASTGGTEAVKVLLNTFPSEVPPIVIVQHIPPVFSRAFAERLNAYLPFDVKEAEDGDKVIPNRVLVAPGNFHMTLEYRGGELVVKLDQSAPRNSHRPSVDRLFESVSSVVGKNSIGILLTGMGADGAKGLLSMKRRGCPTIVQNEESCVVYGMPKAAVELGAADQVLDLFDIANALSRYPGAKIAV